MKPLTLVQGKPSDLWSYDLEDISAHGEEDDHRIDREIESSTSGEPDAELQSIERRQSLIARLDIPAHDEEQDV